jgi:3-hydroxy-9,10-secoandrosta-1,3,5(10)-triene-9,17-dione monooxygenase
VATTGLEAGWIPVPEPDLTPREMVERATALRSFLRDKQAETEAARRILDEVNERFVAAGFYRLLQPRRFGGFEFDLPTFARVNIEVARGCPSSAWSMTFTAGHTHVISKFAKQAQVEVYGKDGEFRAPMAGGISAVARPVEGGYRVTGAWDYSSGCDVSTHFIGSCSI